MHDLTLIRVRLLPIASDGFFKRFILFMNFIFLSLICMPKIKYRFTGNIGLCKCADFVFVVYRKRLF